MSYLQRRIRSLVTCTMKNDLQIDFCVVGEQKRRRHTLQLYR